MKNSTLLTIVFLIPLYGIAQSDLQVDGNVQLNRNRSTIFFQGDFINGHRGGIQFLTFNNGTNFIFQPTNSVGTPVNSTLTLGGFGSFSTNIVNLGVSGKLGVGVSSPQAILDVGSFISNETLGTVFGRLPEGNSTGNGTYLGVRGYATQQDEYNGKSFALEHAFYGNVNSSINFYRGGGQTGGFLTFHTNANVERMRISTNGYVGIGNINPQAPLDVNGNLVLRNMNNVSLAGSSIHFTSYNYNNPGPTIKSVLYYAQDADSRSALVLSSYRGEYKNELYLYDGNVGIGTFSPDAKLAVKGHIHSQEVRVDMTGAMVPDYVFEKDYNLPTLAEVETYINQYKHLPEVPAAKEMEANGVNLGEMNMLLLKKIEELTLHAIEQNKNIELLKKEIEALKSTK